MRTTPRPKALVVGIDGLRWDRIAVAAPPRLTGLIRSGHAVPSLLDVSSGTLTESGPGWSTVARGVWPDRHGVLDNTFAGARLTEYPDFLTRLKRARPELSTLVALDWPPLYEQGVFGADVDVRLLGDGEEHSYPVEDARLTAAAVDHLLDGDPDAAFVYLGSVDIAGHLWGAMSPEYTHWLHETDRWLGALLDAVGTRVTYRGEHWLVLVTTDHGHRDEGDHGGHSDAERSTFVVAHAAGRDGGLRPDTALVDVAATVLDHLGVAVPAELAGRPAWRDGPAGM
jgi:predicted AlkP superfamily pyrophosphatase or phosphodiesterase